MTFRDNIIYLDSASVDSLTVDRFSNEIYHSKLSRLVDFSYESNFTIKYCARGRESYQVNGRSRHVDENKYMVLNRGNEVLTDTTRFSEGISVFLEYEVINDTYHNLHRSEQMLLDDPLYDGSDIAFFEHVYPADDDLGIFLDRIHRYSGQSFGNGKIQLSPLFYYNLAEHLIRSQFNVRQKIDSIQRVKESTSKEIYRRILTAREFIDENYDQNFHLEEAAQVACMSKYHFLRSFNDAFNVTPFEYHRRIRMRRARKLLKSGNYNVTEVSREMGFNNLSTFSKSFKKYFGMTPSQVRRQA